MLFWPDARDCMPFLLDARDCMLFRLDARDCWLSRLKRGLSLLDRVGLLGAAILFPVPDHVGGAILFPLAPGSCSSQLGGGVRAKSPGVPGSLRVAGAIFEGLVVGRERLTTCSEAPCAVSWAAFPLPCIARISLSSSSRSCAVSLLTRRLVSARSVSAASEQSWAVCKPSMLSSVAFSCKETCEGVLDALLDPLTGWRSSVLSPAAEIASGTEGLDVGRDVVCDR